MTDKQAFFAITSHQTRFDQPIDRNGYQRDSDGWSADAGLAFTMTGKLNGDVFVRYLDNSYDDPRLPGISGWTAGAGLTWTPTQMTSVGARISSNIQPTTYEYASGYLMTLYTVRVDHELMRNLQINGFISYRTSDYELLADAPEGARTDDKSWQAGLGLSYFVNRHVFFSAAYTYDTLSSNVPGDDYDVNNIWLTLSLER
jgi:hypothetical protein